MENLNKITLICAWFVLILGFIALGLGLSATALEAIFCSVALFIVYSFTE